MLAVSCTCDSVRYEEFREACCATGEGYGVEDSLTSAEIDASSRKELLNNPQINLQINFRLNTWKLP